MTTVYIATAGEYSDYRVKHAFASRADAEAYKLGDEVLELELHDGPVEVRPWYRLTWRADMPDNATGGPGRPIANPYTDPYGDERDFDGDEKHVSHRWARPLFGSEDVQLLVEGWDLALVKKVYSEQRAQYIARREGIA